MVKNKNTNALPCRGIVMLGLMASLCLGQAPNLDLPNGGLITGGPGQTIGWGFTFDDSGDTSGDFLLITGSDFCLGAFAPPCFNSLGSYSDFVGADQFLVIGPSPYTLTATQDFDLSAETGTGSFTIVPAASLGDSVSGTLTLSYDVYDGDPAGGSANLIAGSLTVSALAEVQVVSDTPEPATVLLLVLGGFGLAIPARRASWRRPVGWK
jgi:hypothetical protein